MFQYANIAFGIKKLCYAKSHGILNFYFRPQHIKSHKYLYDEVLTEGVSFLGEPTLGKALVYCPH